MSTTGSFFCEYLRSGLQERRVILPRLAGPGALRFVLLQSGDLRVSTPDAEDPFAFFGPALWGAPVEQGQVVRLAAGSVGAQMVVGQFGLSAALGRKPEAAEMRAVTDLPVLMPLQDNAALADRIVRIFNTVLAETGAPQQGSDTIVEAEMRHLLVLVWRHMATVQSAAQSPGTDLGVLRQFQSLIEAHFRDRWQVQDYAAAMGTTADRLHDVTRRAAAAAPSELIHARLHHEARILLERSSLSIEQIAHALGFPSAPQFSRFFRSKEDMPPGRFRSLQRSGTEQPPAEAIPGLADWP